MHVRTGFQGSSVRFSPYEDGRLAVGTAQNFGIIGNGRQHVFQVLGQAVPWARDLGSTPLASQVLACCRRERRALCRWPSLTPRTACTTVPGVRCAAPCVMRLRGSLPPACWLPLQCQAAHASQLLSAGKWQRAPPL